MNCAVIDQGVIDTICHYCKLRMKNIAVKTAWHHTIQCIAKSGATDIIQIICGSCKVITKSTNQTLLRRKFSCHLHSIHGMHGTHDTRNLYGQGSVNQLSEAEINDSEPADGVGTLDPYIAGTSSAVNSQADAGSFGDISPATMHPLRRFAISIQSNPRINMAVAQEVISQVSSLVQDFSTFSSHTWTNAIAMQSAIDTEHKRFRWFRAEGYVPPETKKIGQRSESVLCDGVVQQQMIDCDIQYVSIVKTLDTVLNKPTFKHLVKTHTPSTDGELRSFSDGSRYRHLPIFQQDNHIKLQLKLYQDDIEVANPLGANSGIYKLTMYYFNIINIPPEYHSLLCHHHLVCIAFASDVKRFSHNAVTKLIAEEIKQLEAGVLIRNELVYGTLVAISGDNLGLNSIIGMVESFSAIHYCRFCLLSKAECQTNTSCAFANSRTRSTHEHIRHTENIDVRATGVVRFCALDALDNFKAIESFTPDIMHDILEGVAKVDLAAIIESLIQQKAISLNMINQYLDAFNYGSQESSNKPRLLSKVNGRVFIKQSAARMWCLLRVFPVIIGEHVPNASEEWELLRLLLAITHYAFRPTHTIASTQYLELLVEEHHNIFLQLYPESPLTPKQHNLCHYGEAIRRNGPLVQFSALRSEAKHQLAKITATLTCNFKNIPLTIARKYQLKSFADWMQNEIYPKNSTDMSIDGQIKSVTINGSKFSLQSVVVQHRRLYQISNMVLQGSTPVLIAKYLKAKWSPKLIAYVVEEPQVQEYLTMTTTQVVAEYQHPMTIWQSPSGTRCVVPRYNIDVDV